ncbi:MAG: DNA-binding protein YbiB [Burkholderiales bacterium]|nr:DNA-binding protein YbiB [Burkholderiales bacterium]
MQDQLVAESFPCARFIREIGRGKEGARSLSEDDAFALYSAMLDGRVSDLELGAVVLALRVKGESVAELTGFLSAAHAAMELIAAPEGDFAPLLIPSYNGARNMANLTPLLALLLAKEGVPVLVHGVETDPGRVTTHEVMVALGMPMPQQQVHLFANWRKHLPSFMSIDLLAPKMARLLALRRILGVRGSTHTLVKLLQPFACPAVRLTSFTHPEYQMLLSTFFSHASAAGDALLMRATEGETVANVRRAQEIVCFRDGQRTSLVAKQEVGESEVDLPEGRDAETTARWIDDVLCGVRAVPPAIAEQVAQCVAVCADLKARTSASAPELEVGPDIAFPL